MRSHPLQETQPTITILMLDDSDTDRVLYTRYLRSASDYQYQILNRVKLQEGIALWRSQPLDVVLLNVHLPDGDGLGFLEFLRADRTDEGLHYKLPVIILTTQNDEQAAKRGMQLGAMDYLLKEDITATSLHKSILATIENQSLIRQLVRSQQQTKLLTQIAQQMQQSLDLPPILQATVDGLRSLLNCDRAMIYQFPLDGAGWIAVESVCTAELSILSQEMIDPYILSQWQTQWQESYRSGKASQVNGLVDASLESDSAELLASIQVHANLVVPILHNEHLWGLLIVHQCYQPRSWETADAHLVQQVAAQVSLAIQQAHINAQLQTELKGRQGQPQHMVGINYDITARKQFEAMLGRYTQEVEDLYNNAPCGYHSLDPEGRWIRVNETELQWLGYTREEILGKPFTEFLTEASRQTFFENYGKFCQQGWIKNLEFDMVCKDGSILPILLNATAVKDEDGNYLYSRSTLMEVRDRKATEIALKESETQFRRMAENVPGMIYRYVLHPNGTDEFTYVSPHVEDIYELETEAVIQNATCLWLRIHPDDILLMKAATEVSAKNLQSFSVEHRLITPRAGLKWVHVISSPERQDNGDFVWNGVVQDITDRKAAEAQLQRTNTELAQATHLKDEFLANMSHELRTPLNAILGLSEALQDLVLGGLNERQLKAIGTIEKSGRHLLELINDILDLSKISSGKMEFHVEPVSVENLCSSSLPFVKQQAFKKNIQVTSDIASNIGNIVVDERRMRQVLINLLNNAIKFTPEGGQVSLKVAIGFDNSWQGNVAIPAQLRSQTVPLILFQVTDTGIGIAPTDLTRLFQPFVQIDSSLNRQQPGTGLGLAMVKQITEMHGGQVMVESWLGQGSCFTVALPYQLPIASDLSSPASVETGFSSSVADASEQATVPLILLAEDNEANVETFAAYLASRNYQIMVARNGEEAVALAKSGHPDIILMDIQMPKMDGLEAIRLIRSDERLVDVPIIALTALAMPGDQERCIEAGANQYLSKPVGLRQLVKVIQQLLRN